MLNETRTGISRSEQAPLRMIIDCHGHYTTAPPGLGAYRDRQKVERERDPGHPAEKGVIDLLLDANRKLSDAIRDLTFERNSRQVYSRLAAE